MITRFPSLPLLLQGALFTMAVVGLIYSVRMYLRHQSTPDPQKSRQLARLALGPMILGIVIILTVGQLRPEKETLSYWAAIPMIVVALRFAWMILHEPTASDAVGNFAHDREHCGRCGYSVTGNVSGRCSECGWDFPTGELPTEEPDWSAWWRKWRIRYLRHYRWNLSSYIGLGLYCIAMGVYFWSQDNVPQAIVIALVGTHLLINAVRVIQYLLRRQ